MATFSTFLNERSRSYQVSDKVWKLVVPGIFVLACVVRVLALLSLSKTVYFTNLMPDEFLYHAWASEIANGTYRPSSVYQFAPLPAYVMAAVYKLLSPDIFYIRILNIVLIQQNKSK